MKRVIGLIGMLVCLWMLSGVNKLYAQEYSLVQNIPYRDSVSEYALDRCKLDVYYPQGGKERTTVVWFHGGGLS